MTIRPWFSKSDGFAAYDIGTQSIRRLYGGIVASLRYLLRYQVEHVIFAFAIINKRNYELSF